MDAETTVTRRTVLVAKVADIPVGTAVSATLDGKPILISRPTAGQIVAFTAGPAPLPLAAVAVDVAGPDVVAA